MTKVTEKELREKQISFYNKIGDTDFEAKRPHGSYRLYRFMIEYKLNNLRNIANVQLQGKTVLSICCGSGMEAEYFTRLGTHVIGVDISAKTLKGARERANLFCFNMGLVLGDCMRLPVKTSAVDYAVAYEGLHHLFDPELGIKEMARVAKKGIFFLEPCDTIATRFAMVLGIAAATEPSGNPVHRFREKQLIRLLASLGLTRLRFKRLMLEFPHKPLPFYRIFQNSVLFSMMKFVIEIANMTAGNVLGNKIVVFATREKAAVRQ